MKRIFSFYDVTNDETISANYRFSSISINHSGDMKVVYNIKDTIIPFEHFNSSVSPFWASPDNRKYIIRERFPDRDMTEVLSAIHQIEQYNSDKLN